MQDFHFSLFCISRSAHNVFGSARQSQVLTNTSNIVMIIAHSTFTRASRMHSGVQHHPRPVCDGLEHCRSERGEAYLLTKRKLPVRALECTTVYILRLLLLLLLPLFLLLLLLSMSGLRLFDITTVCDACFASRFPLCTHGDSTCSLLHSYIMITIRDGDLPLHLFLSYLFYALWLYHANIVIARAHCNHTSRR